MTRRAIIALGAGAAAVGVLVWLAANAGPWLVVEDDLQQARAVVVLSGQVPFRAMEAADI